MKKLVVLSLMLIGLGLIETTQAQGFYLKARGGYGIGTAKDGYYKSNNYGIVTNDASEQVFASFGQGVPLSVSVGYDISNNIGVELDLTYLLGDKIRIADYNTTTVKNVVEGHTRQYQISPNLVLSTGFDKPLSLYTKFGLVMPAGGATYLDVVNNSSPVEVKQTTKVVGKFTVGYKAALGVNYKVSKSISIFGELESVNLKVKRGKSEVTKYELNGIDNLANYESSSRKINVTYYDKLTSTELADPSKALATISPYSKLGFNIGVCFHL